MGFRSLSVRLKNFIEKSKVPKTSKDLSEHPIKGLLIKHVDYLCISCLAVASACFAVLLDFNFSSGDSKISMYDWDRVVALKDVANVMFWVQYMIIILLFSGALRAYMYKKYDTHSLYTNNTLVFIRYSSALLPGLYLGKTQSYLNYIHRGSTTKEFYHILSLVASLEIVLYALLKAVIAFWEFKISIHNYNKNT